MTRSGSLRHVARQLALVIAAASVALPAQADKVWLNNGNYLEGRASVLDSGDVTIETTAGTMTIPATSVVRVERTETHEERVAEYLRLNPRVSADTLYQLGAESRDLGSATLARQLFERAIELDPDHGPARRALGYRQSEHGRWVTEEEWHALRGEVYHDGQWISAEARDRILESEAARRAAEAQASVEVARLALEAERRREAQVQSEWSTGIPYWYVWTPSAVPIYPPGHFPRPPRPTHPIAPGNPGVVRPSPLSTPAPVAPSSRSTFRPPR